MLAGALDEDSLKLYTLIWSRTMACQMEPATIDQVRCKFSFFSLNMLYSAK